MLEAKAESAKPAKKTGEQIPSDKNMEMIVATISSIFIVWVLTLHWFPVESSNAPMMIGLIASPSRWLDNTESARAKGETW